MVQSRFERDGDYTKLQGQRLDWFSRLRILETSGRSDHLHQ